MSLALYVPGHTILHELTHWDVEVDKATGTCGGPLVIDDYGWNGATVTGTPQTGYGAYNCKLLNKRTDLDPKENADSYVWLAVEAWLANKCPGRPIRDPPP